MVAWTDRPGSAGRSWKAGLAWGYVGVWIAWDDAHDKHCHYILCREALGRGSAGPTAAAQGRCGIVAVVVVVAVVAVVAVWSPGVPVAGLVVIVVIVAIVVVVVADGRRGRRRHGRRGGRHGVDAPAAHSAGPAGSVADAFHAREMSAGCGHRRGADSFLRLSNHQTGGQTCAASWERMGAHGSAWDGARRAPCASSFGGLYGISSL